jgi:hypothetical protein
LSEDALYEYGKWFSNMKSKEKDGCRDSMEVVQSRKELMNPRAKGREPLFLMAFFPCYYEQ